MKTPDELIALAQLLDDEDEDVALNVIANLLDREEELGDLPALLQENPDPLVRRRAHQLQAAMTFRRRRREFFAKLQQDEPDFLSGLVDLHMLWFDRDSRTAIEAELAKFVLEARQRPLNSLDDARKLMSRTALGAELESTIHPENYCIGTILTQRTGAGSLLCGLLRDLMGEKERFQVVRFCGEFAVCDRQEKSLLLAQGDWRVCHVGDVPMEIFSPRDILNCAGNILFSAAVNSDSFRYVLTIAQSLTGDRTDTVLKNLPYPYRG